VEDIRMEPLRPILVDNISDTRRWRSSEVPDRGAHHGDLPVGVDTVPPLYARVLLSPLEVVETLQTKRDRFVVGFLRGMIVVRFFPCWPIMGNAEALQSDLLVGDTIRSSWLSMLSSWVKEVSFCLGGRSVLTVLKRDSSCPKLIPSVGGSQRGGLRHVVVCFSIRSFYTSDGSRLLLVVVFDKFGGVYLVSRFPAVMSLGISFPLKEILQLFFPAHSP
jgi:hypothetical protein